jgi:hypothetical protein
MTENQTDLKLGRTTAGQSPIPDREGRPQLAGLFDLFDRHPLISAVLIWALDLVFVSLITLTAKVLLPRFSRRTSSPCAWTAS